MAYQTVTGTATVARVNLLPPEIGEKAKAKRAKVAMVGTGLAAVGVVGAMYVVQSAKVSGAESDLTAAKARTTALNADLAKLNNVRDVYARRAATEQVLAAAMAREIRWSRFLTDLGLTIPSDVWLNEFNAKQSADGLPGAQAAAAGQSASNQVLADPGLGQVSFNGVAMDWYDVAAWLESLAKQKGYVNAFATRAERLDPKKPKEPIKFESSVHIDGKALSNRYTKRVGG